MRIRRLLLACFSVLASLGVCLFIARRGYEQWVIGRLVPQEIQVSRMLARYTGEDGYEDVCAVTVFALSDKSRRDLLEGGIGRLGGTSSDSRFVKFSAWRPTPTDVPPEALLCVRNKGSLSKTDYDLFNAAATKPGSYYRARENGSFLLVSPTLSLVVYAFLES